MLDKSEGKKLLPEPLPAINAALCGVFAISAGCNSLTNTASLIVGIFSAIFFVLAGKLFHRFKIDDPCSSSLVHGISGFWGIISVGIFEKTDGLIYSGNPIQLRTQLIGGLAILVWAGSLSFAYFFVLNKLQRLRVPKTFEVIGVDLLYHSDASDIDGSKYLQQFMERGKVQKPSEPINFLSQATDFSNQTIQDMHQEGERAI